MREEKITADRLTTFSDAVFAVIVTVMVLELKAPDQPAFSALWPLWPTAISYAMSYLLVSAGMRCMARRRSLLVLAGFTTAMLVALVAPRVGFGLICAA